VAAMPFAVLLFGLLTCGGLLALLVWLVSRRPAVEPADIAGVVARRTGGLRWAGVTAGLIVGVIAAQSGGLGTGLLLAAPLFGLGTLLGVLLGELTVRPPRGPMRTAALEVRRIHDYLPRRLSWVVAAAGGTLLALITATAAAGSPDDLGRPGRSLVRQCASGAFESHGPWPGLFYAGQLAAVVVVGLLMAYAAVHFIVRRPRPGGSSDLAGDDALRRRAARTVTGAVGILIALPLAGVSLTAAGGLLGTSCAPTWWTAAGWGLLALVAVSLVILSWCVATVFIPMERADALARTP